MWFSGSCLPCALVTFSHLPLVIHVIMSLRTLVDFHLLWIPCIHVKWMVRVILIISIVAVVRLIHNGSFSLILTNCGHDFLLFYFIFESLDYHAISKLTTKTHGQIDLECSHVTITMVRAQEGSRHFWCVSSLVTFFSFNFFKTLLSNSYTFSVLQQQMVPKRWFILSFGPRYVHTGCLLSTTTSASTENDEEKRTRMMRSVTNSYCTRTAGAVAGL